MKKRYTDAELLADIQVVTAGTDPAEAERNAYFADPANAAKIEEQQTRMDLVIAANNKQSRTRTITDTGRTNGSEVGFTSRNTSSAAGSR